MLKIIKNLFYLSLIIATTLIVANSTISKRNYNINTKIIPQEYMKNVEVTHFNIEGNIKDKLKAEYWAYLPAEGVSKISTPKMELTKPNNNVWLVSAKYAIAKHKKLDSKITELQLNENVKIERPKKEFSTPIQLTTKQLFYFPQNEYVTTDEFVEMLKPGLQITGTGLNGYLDNNRIELKNDVKTNYISTS